MRFFDYIKLAFRNLSRRKLRTFLTTIAVVIGAFAVTAFVSIGQNVNKGFNKMINDMGILNIVTVTKDPDAEAGGGMYGTNDSSNSGGKKIDDTTLATVKKMDHVVDAVAMVNVQGFEKMELKGGNGKKIWPNLMGFDPDNQAFQVEVTAGRMVKKDDIGKIVLGASNAATFGYQNHPDDVIGKKVILSTKGGWYTGWGTTQQQPPQNADKSWWEAQNNKTAEIEVEVVGVAGSTGEDGQNYIGMDFAHAIMTQHNWQEDSEAIAAWKQRQDQAGQSGRKFTEPYPAQKLVATDQITQAGYNSILIKADDTKNTDAIGAAVIKMGYGANTPKEMISGIMKVINVVTIVLAAIGALALIVAAIGIVNTMAMAIFERRREIGVMRACGATRATVRRLFTFESALIGFTGGLFGIAFTYGVAKLADHFIIDRGTLPLPIDTMADFPIWLTGSVVGFTTIMALFAGLYPAFKAARLNPVEALRQQQ